MAYSAVSRFFIFFDVDYYIWYCLFIEMEEAVTMFVGLYLIHLHMQCNLFFNEIKLRIFPRKKKIYWIRPSWSHVQI